MPVDFVSIENVPICGTGEYALSSGTTTFSAEDLADAVRAAQDPTVPAPRIKIGHTDPRFSDLDGEPAFGSLSNLRLSDNGQEIVADMVDVPQWLADSMASAYPGRSIEGGKSYTAPSGREYKLAISNMSLLGVTQPGITSLPDLREILERNGAVPEPIAASAGGFEARIKRPGDDQPADIVAGLDLGNVREQFCADLDEGDVPTPDESQPQADDVGPQMMWWPRSIRVEDDGSLTIIADDGAGHLVRIPFTVQQGDLVYGQPELVVEQYTPVTSDPDESGEPVMARGPRVLASWPIRAASRPSTTPEAPPVSDMDYAAVLRKRLGLAEDADDAAITEALAAEPTVEPVVAPPALAPVPEGMVLVDQETFSTVRSQAEEGAAVAASIKTQRKQTVIQAAAVAGKFPVSRREHYAKLWDRDPEGTEHLLTASEADGGLAAGLVPVQASEVGQSGDGEGQPQTEVLEHDRFMAANFPNERARLQGANPGPRVRQEA